MGKPAGDRLYGTHVQDNAEESVREVIAGLEDGNFLYKMDTGQQVQVAITVERETRSARVDFTGTSAQHAGNYNAPFAVSRAVVLYVFRLMVGKNIPLNEGCLKPLDIIVPENSMLNPQYPAAVIAGNTEVSQAACNALIGALGIMAGSQGTMNNFVWGNEVFQNYETIAGGTGAGPSFNGCDAVQTHMTNTKMTDPEILEKRFPVRLRSFAIRGWIWRCWSLSRWPWRTATVRVFNRCDCDNPMLSPCDPALWCGRWRQWGHRPKLG